MVVKGDYFTGLDSAGIIRCLEVHGPTSCAGTIWSLPRNAGQGGRVKIFLDKIAILFLQYFLDPFWYASRIKDTIFS
jgi:hypothetical protein